MTRVITSFKNLVIFTLPHPHFGFQNEIVGKRLLQCIASDILVAFLIYPLNVQYPI